MKALDLVEFLKIVDEYFPVPNGGGSHSLMIGANGLLMLQLIVLDQHGQRKFLPVTFENEDPLDITSIKQVVSDWEQLKEKLNAKEA